MHGWGVRPANRLGPANRDGNQAALSCANLLCTYLHILVTWSTTCLSVRVSNKPHLLTDEAMVMIARRFGVLSDPMRIRLLHSLFDGEKNVGSLVKVSGSSQTNVSRHLQTLADAGILARRKAGAQAFYSICDPSIFELCELVCRSLEIQHASRAKLMARQPAK